MLSPSLAAFIENLSQLLCNNVIVPRWESGIPRNTGVPRDRDWSPGFRENLRTLHDRVKIQCLQSWPAIVMIYPALLCHYDHPLDLNAKQDVCVADAVKRGKLMQCL